MVVSLTDARGTGQAPFHGQRTLAHAIAESPGRTLVWCDGERTVSLILYAAARTTGVAVEVPQHVDPGVRLTRDGQTFSVTTSCRFG